MPFAVSKWPYSPDPRTGVFGGYGWAPVAVPSWQWMVATTNATGRWAPVNDGILIPSLADSFGFTLWEGPNVEASIVASIFRFGFQPPISGPISQRLNVQLATTPPTSLAVATINYFYPNAIQVFGGFLMFDTATGLRDPDLPDEVTLTPALWNLEPV